MIRDKVGAEATNLTGSDVRQDIYGIIRDKVLARAKQDAQGEGPNRELAQAWVNHITRKTVKRAVMTTPYGLTDIGMRDQLIRDGHCKDLDGDTGELATYLRDVLRWSIDSTVIASRTVMSWMQQCALAVAHADRPLTWTTPVGFVVRQAYHKTSSTRIATVAGVGKYKMRMTLQNEDEAQGLRIRKQQDAIAPNIIHSFDSAHMMLSVLNARDCGLQHFAVIHDSFGCHAADMPVFLNAIRSEFATMYQTDWIATLAESFQVCAPGTNQPKLAVFTDDAYDSLMVLLERYFFA
jgi:DNA-directed RNA polymerase